MAKVAAGASVGAGSRNRRPSVLTPRALELLAELRLLVLLAFAAMLFLVLFTYTRSDPGWSNEAMGVARNIGGKLGAYAADFILYLFGISSYLWVVLCLVLVYQGHQGIRALRVDSANAKSGARGRKAADEATETAITNAGMANWERWLGFGLLLLGCSGLEATRMYSLQAQLPMAPGGVVGDLIGSALVSLTGAVGSTLSLLVLVAAGVSLFFSVSWLTIFERTGAALEWCVRRARLLAVARSDRKIGVQAASERIETLVEKRKILAPLAEEPVFIAQPIIIEPSKQAYKERQENLFTDRDLAETDLPSISLLDLPPAAIERIPAETLEYTSRLIEKKLSDFGVVVNVVSAQPGPVITRYEIEPAIGVKGSQIVNLARDLSRALSVQSVRVVETIPGKSFMGLEIPNPKRQAVKLSEIIAAKNFGDASSPLTLALGKDIAGLPVSVDLAKMPHLLVAGTTGSGKSVGINAMLLSLLYKAGPNQVRLILIDPKMLEMSVYEGIPHLLAPVVTDMKQAAHALNWCVAEMERRYKLLSKVGVRNLAGYNAKIAEADKRGEKIPNPFSLTPDAPEPIGHLPQIVVFIDELADLMMVVGKKIEELIARLAQKARAAGIHLVLATQRPSVDVITGLIKANIPTRLAFQVSSKIDSRTILDQMGAEALLGQGDMLFMPPGTGLPQRLHGAFVSDEEVNKVVEHWRQWGEPDYIEGILEGGVMEDVNTGSAVGFGGLSTTLAEAGVNGESDELYDQAVAVVLQHKRASISLVQRHLRIGYNRAARLLEQMEKSGVVSTMASNGNRDILVPHVRDNA
jgi:DNA segregation ATPase FtsK/SpoIIIE, S-DNA-T family